MTEFDMYHADLVHEAVGDTRQEAYLALAQFGGRPQFAGEAATATCTVADCEVLTYGYVQDSGVIWLDTVIVDRPTGAPSRRRWPRWVPLLAAVAVLVWWFR
jgi:hypothetical protein